MLLPGWYWWCGKGERKRQGRCLSTSLASGKDQSQLLDMCWIRSLILRQQLSKYADGFLLGEDWKVGISAYSSVLGPVVIAAVSVHAPVHYFFVYCGLVDTNLVGFQSWVFSDPIPWVGVLKVGSLNVGSKLFVPWKEAGSWELPPAYRVLYQAWGLWWECVSALPTCFVVGIFIFTCCVSQLVSRFLSVVMAVCVVNCFR